MSGRWSRISISSSQAENFIQSLASERRRAAPTPVFGPSVRGDDPRSSAGYGFRGLCRQNERAGRIDDVFVLVPKERPALLELGEVGLNDHDPRDHAAWDETEVGPIVAVRDELRARAYRRDVGDVRDGMPPEDVVERAQRVLDADDSRKRLMQEIRVHGESRGLGRSPPGACRDRDAEGVSRQRTALLLLETGERSLERVAKRWIHVWQGTGRKPAEPGEVPLDDR